MVTILLFKGIHLFTFEKCGNCEGADFTNLRKQNSMRLAVREKTTSTYTTEMKILQMGLVRLFLDV